MFKIASNIVLPKEAVTWVISYIAKRGAGKTYNASVQAEEMLKAQVPIVVVDGMGIWWGLRVSYDGTSRGLPVVVFGGEHADLPLVPEKASEMAKAIVESNISCVLDLSAFAKFTARRIVAAFLNELYRLNRVERHVFIEEADLWAPQRPLGPEENLCLSAVDNFVRRGGNHNLGCTLITQRSAVLNKDILTQSDCLVILRTLAPQDKKAISLWVEEQTDTDKKELKEWYDSLKSLENGEAWVWHPEKPTIYVKTKFRHRETFHATREFIRSPRASQIVLMDVDDFIQKFKNVFEPKPKEQIISPRVEIPIPPQPKTDAIKELQADFQRVQKEQDEHATGTRNITEQQALPTITIQQYKPNVMLPVEALEQPTTALGKITVILKNDSLKPGHRQDQWTTNRIKTHIQEHGWEIPSDIENAIAQLLRWEILTRVGNYFRFWPKRVIVTSQENNVLVK